MEGGERRRYFQDLHREGTGKKRVMREGGTHFRHSKNSLSERVKGGGVRHADGAYECGLSEKASEESSLDSRQGGEGSDEDLADR